MRSFQAVQRRRRPSIPGKSFQSHSGSAHSTSCKLTAAEDGGARIGRWPVKSAKFLANLISNAAANATANELDVEDLIIKNINVQQAPKTHRRTYRAHGRINPYKVCFGSLTSSEFD